MKKSYHILVLMLIIQSSCNYCDLVGSYELGNNLILMEGDRTEDRIIMRCSGRSKGCCYIGEYILPTYKEHYSINGKYREYVIKAEYNNEWIIVQTGIVKSDTIRYWYIDKSFSVDNLDCQQFKCDSLILAHRFGPYSKSIFTEKVKTKKIPLTFKN